MIGNSGAQTRNVWVSSLAGALLVASLAEAQQALETTAPRDLCQKAPDALRQCGVSHLGLSDFHSNLLPATQMVLEGWSIRVQTVQERLGATANPALEQAARICREQGLDALAWTSGGERTATLWVYNHRHGDVVVRRIAPPPYSEASAVSVALSLKTALRDTGQTPRPEMAQPPQSTAATQLAVALPPQSAPPSALPESPPNGWLLQVSSGYRWGNQDFAQNGPRLQLEVRGELNALARGSYVGISASSSPPLALHGTPIDAQLWDVTPQLTVGWLSSEHHRLRWGGHGGLGVRFSSLSGTLLSEGVAFSESRRSAVLSAGLEVATHWKSLRLALQPTVSQVLRGRHYALDGQPLLAESTTWWSLSVGFGLYAH